MCSFKIYNTFSCMSHLPLLTANKTHAYVLPILPMKKARLKKSEMGGAVVAQWLSIGL